MLNFGHALNAILHYLFLSIIVKFRTKNGKLDVLLIKHFV